MARPPFAISNFKILYFSTFNNEHCRIIANRRIKRIKTSTKDMIQDTLAEIEDPDDIDFTPQCSDNYFVIGEEEDQNYE